MPKQKSVKHHVSLLAVPRNKTFSALKHIQRITLMEEQGPKHLLDDVIFPLFARCRIVD